MSLLHLSLSLNIFYFQSCTLQHINNTITQRNREIGLERKLIAYIAPHLSLRGCVYLHLFLCLQVNYVSGYKQCLPFNIFYIYVIGLYAHGPSWPNASIKYLSKIAANAVLVKSKVKGAINMQYN